MGKAAKRAPAEAVEFPSNVYGIFPKALSELSEVCTCTKAFSLIKEFSTVKSLSIWYVVRSKFLQTQPYLIRRILKSIDKNVHLKPFIMLILSIHDNIQSSPTICPDLKHTLYSASASP